MRRTGPILAAALAALATPAAAPAATPVTDPAREPIPGAYNCYLEARGDQYRTPAFTLTIGAGGAYSLPVGSGTFIVDPNEKILPLRFQGGPFGADAYGAVRWDDWGQRIAVFATPAGDLYCYAQGASDAAAQIDLAAKDPKPGTYGCAARDTGAAAAPLEILSGRQYRVGGATGAYTADVLGDFGDDFSGVSFTSGPLTDVTGFYSENILTGARKLSVFTDVRLECRGLGRPTPKPRFGPGKAPKPAPGAGGLTGAYAGWTVDVTGVCGGLCWQVYVFTPRGYVYTREPRTGLADAACDRLRPNGTPVCERYRVAGGRITIGDDPPEAFRRAGRNLVIGSVTYRPIAVAKKLRLNGEYRAFTYLQSGGGSGGVSVEQKLRFTAAGAFRREGFAGVSVLTTDTGTPQGDAVAGVTVSSQDQNRGTYRLSGPNTLELRYADGTRERAFIFLPEGPSAKPKLLRLGGTNYLLQGAPKPTGPPR